MKTRLIFFVVVCICLAVSIPVNAQTDKYYVIDIKTIAIMLIEEKALGLTDDAPFIAYWDSLGFKKDRQIGFNNYEYKLDNKPITVFIITKDNERRFEILAEDSSFCWYHFIRLKEFGLKGSNTVAKGKGLTAVAGRNRLRISYELPKKNKRKK